MKFDERYLEAVTLPGGEKIRIRAIRPEDKELLAEGFARLGPESVYRRFFSSKSRLTDKELAYLTEVDGHDHVALGALVDEADGADRGVAVARFVRLDTDPYVAEPAIAVADDMQGRGLGGVLLRRLTEAAVERGVRRFRCPVLADNDGMRALMEQIEPHVIVHPVGDGVVELEVRLPGADVGGDADLLPEIPEAERSGSDWMLSAAARRAISVPLRWRRDD